MRYLGFAVVVGALAAVGLVGVGMSDAAAPCSSPHQMRIVDLDTRPDPFRPDAHLQHWFVKLQSEHADCDTEIQVKLGNQIVGERVHSTIGRGTRVYEVPVRRDFKLDPHDHRRLCFSVTVDILGTPAPVDASREFCVSIYAFTLK